MARVLQTRGLSRLATARYGPGSRASSGGLTVAVFGAYGFVGKYLCNELGQCGIRVSAPYRGDEFEPRPLKPMFDLGQLALRPFSPRDDDSIRTAIGSADVVVNLIGKYYETKHLVPTRRDGKLSRVNYTFDDVNVKIARRIAELSKEAGVKNLIHVSSLSADENAPSEWSRTKAAGEKAVREVFPEATIVKLATVFGPEDRFLNWMAEVLARFPAFPVVEDADSLYQPVFAADVGLGLRKLVQDAPQYAGKTFQFAGPSEYTQKELLDFVQDVIQTKKPVISVPHSIAAIGGSAMEVLASPVFTKDMASQVTEDSVLIDDENMGTLQDLDIEPQSLDRLAFDYLHRFRKGGHFTVTHGYH